MIRLHNQELGTNLSSHTYIDFHYQTDYWLHHHKENERIRNFYCPTMKGETCLYIFDHSSLCGWKKEQIMALLREHVPSKP